MWIVLFEWAYSMKTFWPRRCAPEGTHVKTAPSNQCDLMAAPVLAYWSTYKGVMREGRRLCKSSTAG